MANLKVLHIDLDTGEIVAKTITSGPTGNFVEVAGDTMTGFLFLNADPTDPLHSSTKQYVDTAISDLDTEIGLIADGLQLDIDSRVLKAGDTMIGQLVLAGDPTAALEPVTKQYLESVAVLKAGSVMTGFLTLVGNPLTGNHAANKSYVDSAIGGGSGNFLPLEGGTMTGPLILDADPVGNLEAGTKQYIDNEIQSIGTKYLQLTPSSLWAINHGRNTTSLIVQVFEGGEMIIPNAITIIDSDNIEIDFGEQITGETNIVFFD